MVTEETTPQPTSDGEGEAASTTPWRQTIIALLIFMTVATVAGNLSVTHYRQFGFRGDTRHYVGIFEGRDLAEIPPPFRYRVLVPFAARFAPPLPSAFIREPEAEQNQRVLFKFAFTNVIGLTLSATFVLLLMGALGFAWTERLIGGLLFLASYYPLLRGAIPMVDAWAYACLAGCLYALVRRRTPLLFVLFSLGIFVKETTFLVPVAALLLQSPRSDKLAQLTGFVPATLAYLLFRFLLVPAEYPLYGVTAIIEGTYDKLVSGAITEGLIKGLLAFGFLWPLAAFGWTKIKRDRDHPLVRWAPLVLIVLITPFVLVTSIGRTWTYAFPVVIPLAVLGLRSVPGFDSGDR